MLTIVPFFKELIISSFECDHCHFKNNEIQAASEIQDFGHILSLHVLDKSDVQRDIVRSEYATIKIPQLDFEIPPSKKGQVTTIEGIMQKTVEELSLYQDERRA